MLGELYCNSDKVKIAYYADDHEFRVLETDKKFEKASHHEQQSLFNIAKIKLNVSVYVVYRLTRRFLHRVQHSHIVFY